MEPSKTKHNLIFFLRHGERADLSGFVPKYDYDTPLSENGYKQASDGGRFIRQQINQFLSPEAAANVTYQIYASPFIRAVSTSCYIAKELGVPRVRVLNRVAECLMPERTKNMNASYLRDGELFGKDGSVADKKFTGETEDWKVEVEDNNEGLEDLLALAPESEQVADARIRDSVLSFVEECAGQPGKVIVCVAHMFAVTALKNALLSSELVDGTLHSG